MYVRITIGIESVLQVLSNQIYIIGVLIDTVVIKVRVIYLCDKYMLDR